jgi:hypothetical protein
VICMFLNYCHADHWSPCSEWFLRKNLDKKLLYLSVHSKFKMINVKKILIGLSVVAYSIGFISCTDDRQDDPVTTTSTTSTTPVPAGISFTQKGILKLNIGHVFGTKAFDLSPASYVTKAQDTIFVSELSYYISNIVLTTVNGTKVPLEGYFLEGFLPGQPNVVTLENVPAGNYTDISYLIGVDSAANSTGTHTGDLDPSYGMYWTWNTGYVFVRLKGRHSAANNLYSFDIGGTDNAMPISHSLIAYKVRGTTVTASLKFDIEKVFNAPSEYDLKVDANDIHSTTSPGIAKFVPNITNAFSLTGVK